MLNKFQFVPLVLIKFSDISMKFTRGTHVELYTPLIILNNLVAVAAFGYITWKTLSVPAYQTLCCQINAPLGRRPSNNWKHRFFTCLESATFTAVHVWRMLLLGFWFCLSVSAGASDFLERIVSKMTFVSPLGHNFTSCGFRGLE